MQVAPIAQTMRRGIERGLPPTPSANASARVAALSRQRELEFRTGRRGQQRRNE